MNKKFIDDYAFIMLSVLVWFLFGVFCGYNLHG